MAAEREEVGAERGHVGRPMRHALGGVDQHQRPRRMRSPRNFGDRVDRAQHVGDRRHGDQLRLRREQSIERVDDQAGRRR